MRTALILEIPAARERESELWGCSRAQEAKNAIH
jgi:hypothetical protein